MALPVTLIAATPVGAVAKINLFLSHKSLAIHFLAQGLPIPALPVRNIFTSQIAFFMLFPTLSFSEGDFTWLLIVMAKQRSSRKYELPSWKIVLAVEVLGWWMSNTGVYLSMPVMHHFWEKQKLNEASLHCYLHNRVDAWRCLMSVMVVGANVYNGVWTQEAGQKPTAAQAWPWWMITKDSMANVPMTRGHFS